jgi:hypothetical protein
MKFYGYAAVSEFLGDNVIYRNLNPMDSRLPSLDEFRDQLNIPAGVTPRKSTAKYAQVMSRILQAAQELKNPGEKLERVVFIGDTRHNDSNAFAKICRAGKWPGHAFIGSENDDPKSIEFDKLDIGTVMVANKWAALADFETYLDEEFFAVDQYTAVLLDLDKTTLGARGRNDHVINQARVDAAAATMKDALGDKFDLEKFQKNYAHFNQPHFHSFTTDNQDYVVYICLMIGAGLYSQSGLECALGNEVITDFESFMVQVDRRAVELAPEIREIHQEVYQQFQLGDPTPFKAFRRAEYLATAARMGQMDPETPLDAILSREIVITHEVRDVMLRWKEQGALLFGLSDKPDEASLPTAELASQGYKSIHQIETAIIGADID